VFGSRIITRRQDAPGSSSVPLEQPSAQPEAPRKPASATPLRPAAKPGPRASSPGEVVSQVLPEAPAKIRDGIRGTVRVRVRANVDPSGNVAGTRLDSAGPSKYFAEMALQAARLWKFKAPTVNSRDVSSEWLLRFAFSRSGTTVVPLQADP